MDRQLFSITKFPKNQLPHYRCPRCQSSLELREVSEEDSAETRISQSNPDFDHDWVRTNFRADLWCTSSRCGERVLCIGTGIVQNVYGETSEGWVEEYVDYWIPTLFQPHLMVFDIPPETPDGVRDSILASFRVLFLSSGSALNEIRNALELLMDHLKVPRKDRGRRLDLHKRVEKMPAEHSQYRDQLLAVKWLGNAGTHAQTTNRDDVLDGYEIIQHVLESLFSGKAARLNRLVAEINTQKAPINL